MFLTQELNSRLEWEIKQEWVEKVLKEERELITIKVNKMMTKNLETD
jgi:hypothetical protein